MKRLYATPALRERFVAMHGSEQGYSAAVEAELQVLTGQTFARGYVNSVIGGRVPASTPMLLNLVRVIESNPDLTNLEALALAAEWFEPREEVKS